MSTARPRIVILGAGFGGLFAARALAKVAADVTLVDGLRSIDEMKRVADEVPGQKQINLILGGKTPILSAAALHDLGFKVVLYSTPALYLTSKALFEQIAVLKSAGDLGAIAEKSSTFGEFQRFVEGRYLKKLEDKKIKI